MNLTKIQERVARSVGDTDFTYIEAADITEWVNEYAIEIAKKIRYNLTTTVINTVSGTPTYALPVGYLSSVSVRYNGINLSPVMYQEVSRYDAANSTSVGSPVNFYVLAGKIGLYPAPSESLTGGLVVEHTSAPALLANGTDVPQLPEELQNYLVYYARAMAQFKMENHELAIGLEDRCERKLMSAIHDFGYSHHEVYPGVGVAFDA